MNHETYDPKPSHTNRLAVLRWRLARWIAPSPIIAAPLGDGPAILIREAGYRAVSWIIPATLDINLENNLNPRRFGDPLALSNYGTVTGGRVGTITGTI